jgi:predicted acetyltransferase
MTAREVLVPIQEKSALAAMMQDYIAEMARIIPGIRVGQPYPQFDLYWSAPDSRWPIWLKVDIANAGFALVSRDKEAGHFEMEEFFVVRGHRRRGVGLAAARRLIRRYPGLWTITQRETNTGAIAFWHRVLDGFVDYDEATTETDAIRREQRFNVA